MKNKPTFTFRDGMTSDEGYIQWISDIKQRFRQSQIKASVRVNTAMLEFYWSMGRDIVELCAESKWGSGFFEQLSLDLRTAFPDEIGFSVTNLKYMKRWYAFYNERVAIRQQVVDELETANRQQVVDEKGQQVVDQLQFPDTFGLVPRGCHILIISKCCQVGKRSSLICCSTTYPSIAMSSLS